MKLKLYAKIIILVLAFVSVGAQSLPDRSVEIASLDLARNEMLNSARASDQYRLMFPQAVDYFSGRADGFRQAAEIVRQQMLSAGWVEPR